MKTLASKARGLFVGGALVAGLLTVTSVGVKAQQTPGNNPAPPRIELPSGGLVVIDDITPFTFRVKWASENAYSRYYVGISGNGQPGRSLQVNSGAPAKRGEKNINRLLPDTEYNIVVKARDGHRWIFIGSTRARTAGGGGTPAETPCDGADVTVNQITKSSARVSISANCDFDEFLVILKDLNAGTVKTVQVKLALPTKRASYDLSPLKSKGRYRVRVHQMVGGQATGLGEPVVFQTL